MSSDLLKQVGSLDEDQQIKFFEKALGNITLGCCLKLVKHLEKEWDVEAAPKQSEMPIFPQELEEEIEQSEFAVHLTAFGQKKIAVIKVVRQLTGKSLKDSKGLVDRAPVLIKENLSKDDAEHAKQQLVDAGGEAEIK